jgi:hypothetical protein
MTVILKNLKKTTSKKIDIMHSHFRIGWEPSPNDFMLVRYHAVACDYGRIATEGRMHKFIEQISKIGAIQIIRQPRKGKVKHSNLEFMFQSFDSALSPKEINLSILGNNVIKDYGFCERKIGKIDEYVERIYL